MGLAEKLVLPLAERYIFATEWEQMVAHDSRPERSHQEARRAACYG